MRWPFGPPHLTLQPSKKNKNKKNKTKSNKKNKKKPRKKKCYQSIFFGQGIQKLPLFDTLAQKTRTQKHYKNRGFGLFFLEKKLCVTKRPFFGQKNPNLVRGKLLPPYQLDLYQLELPHLAAQACLELSEKRVSPLQA